MHKPTWSRNASLFIRKFIDEMKELKEKMARKGTME